MKLLSTLAIIFIFLSCKPSAPELQTGSQSIVEDLDSLHLVLDLYTAEEFTKIMSLMKMDSAAPEGANYMLMATIMEKPEVETTKPRQLKGLNLKFSIKDPENTLLNPVVKTISNEHMAHYASALELSENGVYNVETSFSHAGQVHSNKSSFGIKLQGK